MRTLGFPGDARTNRNFLCTDNKTFSLPPEYDTIVLDQIVRREQLGGLIQSYERAV